MVAKEQPEISAHNDLKRAYSCAFDRVLIYLALVVSASQLDPEGVSEMKSNARHGAPVRQTHTIPLFSDLISTYIPARFREIRPTSARLRTTLEPVTLFGGTGRTYGQE